MRGTRRTFDGYGDFQTPAELARRVCTLLRDSGAAPASILEPACGAGNMLLAALDRFPQTRRAIGIEIQPAYVRDLRTRLDLRADAGKVDLIRESFFEIDRAEILRNLPDPMLIIGNPPWVTNASLGAAANNNLPKKENIRNDTGLDALTGKSNFDIAEWMMTKLLDLLEGRAATMAMLCKTSAARKVLRHAWNRGMHLNDCAMFPFDASATFGASVDACLFICSTAPDSASERRCVVYRSLDDHMAERTVGYDDGKLIADSDAYRRWKHLLGNGPYRWRSGIKHDCARVMELRREGRFFRNGFGELVDIEQEFIYPMLKGSELVSGRAREPLRWMLVPQRNAGDDTNVLRVRAPNAWKYLMDHAALLDSRKSSIYRNRSRFSIFGVGDYSFMQWKVAISGLYKKLQFTAVPPFDGKPVVLDDTSYFITCSSEEEAAYLTSILNSPAAREFYSAFIFWDAKRPITAEILQRLDPRALARELGTESVIGEFLAREMPDPISHLE